MAPCPSCGLDESTISEPDAARALRGLGRRYRDSMGHVAPIFQVESLSGGPSMRDELAAAVVALEHDSAVVASVLDHPELSVDAQDIDWDLAPARATPAGSGPNVADLLARLDVATAALAARADATSWEAWERPFVLGGRTMPARRVLQHAAHEGVHRLRTLDHIRDTLKSAHS